MVIFYLFATSFDYSFKIFKVTEEVVVVVVVAVGELDLIILI
jgi:hypothetical protein